MTRLLLLATAALVLLMGCAQPNLALPPGPALGQASTGDHVVGGYWVGVEHACVPASDAYCDLATSAAIRAVRNQEQAATVTGSVLADFPARCGDRRDEECAFAGLSQPQLAIVDLADGSRRVVLLMCSGEVTAAGRVEREAECQVQDEPGEMLRANP